MIPFDMDPTPEPDNRDDVVAPLGANGTRVSTGVGVVTGRLSVPVTDRDHQLGPADAPVTIVEYGDYACSRCASAHRVIEAVRAQLGDRLRLVYRHFPLTSMNPHAQHAAEVAELAGAQSADGFWAMHSTLYANQDQLDDDDLWRYAADLNLDMATFDRDFDRHLFAPKIVEDKRGGVRSGVNGTPTLFIDGIRYDGEITMDALTGALSGKL